MVIRREFDGVEYAIELTAEEWGRAAATWPAAVEQEIKYELFDVLVYTAQEELGTELHIQELENETAYFLKFVERRYDISLNELISEYVKMFTKTGEKKDTINELYKRYDFYTYAEEFYERYPAPVGKVLYEESDIADFFGDKLDPSLNHYGEITADIGRRKDGCYHTGTFYRIVAGCFRYEPDKFRITVKYVDPKRDIEKPIAVLYRFNCGEYVLLNTIYNEVCLDIGDMLNREIDKFEDQYKTNSFYASYPKLGECSDADFLFKNLSAERLSLVESIIIAAEEGEVDLIDSPDEDGCGVAVLKKGYNPNCTVGVEDAFILMWLNDRIDAAYLCELLNN